MLAVVRLFLLAIVLVCISIGSITLCLIRPFHRNNVYNTAHFMGLVSRLIGVKLEVRVPDELKKVGPCVYIANHQNSWDIFTISAAVQPGTVSVGKKSLKWIPFFGWMYWLTGNILIDRKNTTKARNTIAITAEKIKQKKLSVWLFPEGTRSNGRGLLPFKSGAFHTAQQASVPIVPICASNLHNLVKLNRWDNGRCIIEFLPPIAVKSKESIRSLSQQIHTTMHNKINELSAEAGAELLPELKEKVS